VSIDRIIETASVLNLVMTWNSCAMNKPLVSDELWTLVAPLLPAETPKTRGGRPRIAGRAALTALIVVLEFGIPWAMLPPE
jgi:transposase